MNVHAASPLHRLQVRFARTQQVIGWAGLCGLALMSIAAVVVGLAWMARPTNPAVLPADQVEACTPISTEGPFAKAAPRIAPILAHSADVAQLLRQLELVAVSNGVGWAAADYRITAPTATQASSLEVRSTFKGPYPKLRGMVAQVLNHIPASTLREFSLTRASSELIDVEAKVVIAVLLDDESALARQPQKAVLR